MVKDKKSKFIRPTMPETQPPYPCKTAKPRYIRFFISWQKTYQGFTLLEVMVSLAILATAFVAVLRVHTDSLEMVISSRFHTKAAELAQYKMTEIEGSGLKNLSLMTGRFTDHAPEYRWNISVEPSQMRSWSRVTVTVTNRRAGKGGEFHLTEYMATGPEEKKQGKK